MIQERLEVANGSHFLPSGPSPRAASLLQIIPRIGQIETLVDERKIRDDIP